MKRYVTLIATTLLLVAALPALALPTTARLQIAHLAPFASGAGTSVTVNANGAALLENVLYGNSTGYIDVPAGNYTIDIIPTGTATVAITANATLEAGVSYTAIAKGNGSTQPLSLSLLVDDLTPPAAGNFHLRLGHLAPFASGAATADVRLQDGTPVLLGVNFGDITDFIPLPAGTYDLKITAPGGNPTLIDPIPLSFSAGQLVSAFATGDGNNQALGVFALPSGQPGAFVALGQLLGPATPIPTMGFWGLVLMSLALGAVVLTQRRRLRA